ncbi:MAG: hypothetical protein ACMUIG_08725, partial [Thermoplasmatota archaeon]
MRGEREKENRTRDMVHNYVKTHPGASMPDMMRILQIPEGTLRYHLDYLVRKEKIDTAIRGSRRCYFPAELSGSGTFPGVDPSTLTREQIRIIDVVKRNPGISGSGISELTNLGAKDSGTYRYGYHALNKLFGFESLGEREFEHALGIG